MRPRSDENKNALPIHGRIGRLAKNGSLGRASAYLDEGGEQLQELSLRDMDKHKINRNCKFFLCGYRFAYGVSSFHLSFA